MRLPKASGLHCSCWVFSFYARRSQRETSDEEHWHIRPLALSEIGSNQTEKRGFVISFPKFSPIENKQHGRRDGEAQRRSHQQPRDIEANQEKDGHEKQTETTPQYFTPIEEQVFRTSLPQPDRALQLSRVE